MKSFSRIWLIAFCAILTACYWVEPDRKPDGPVLSKPIFNDAVVQGLVFRDERVVSRSQSSAYAIGTASATGQSNFNGNTYGNVGNQPFNANTWGQGNYSAQGISSASAFGQTMNFESFDNRALLEALGHSLEDHRIIKRITQNSQIRIEGTNLSVWPSTDGGRITWNIVNGITLFCLFGSPFCGSCDASLQIRIYQNDELLSTFNGVGRGYWKANYPGITLAPAKRAAAMTAAQVALADAIEKMCAAPTKK